jgi:hypothetical protein
VEETSEGGEDSLQLAKPMMVMMMMIMTTTTMTMMMMIAM